MKNSENFHEHQNRFSVGSKKIKTILLAVVIATSSVLSASTEPVKEAVKTIITEEVSNLLKNPTFEVTKELLADVRLTINKNNEMVVLSVDSESEQVVNYIKSRLNYNKLSEKVAEKTYVVPVIIKPEDD